MLGPAARARVNCGHKSSCGFLDVGMYLHEEEGLRQLVLVKGKACGAKLQWQKSARGSWWLGRPQLSSVEKAASVLCRAVWGP